LKTILALSLAVQGYFPHIDTLHQPVKKGKKAGEMTQQIKKFFHIHQGVFMTTTHFSNSDNITVGFK
jgi:hypothetical protein